nr:MAG TPA: hypothetical protein [Caudoviricetes sp.]
MRRSSPTRTTRLAPYRIGTARSMSSRSAASSPLRPRS